MATKSCVVCKSNDGITSYILMVDVNRLGLNPDWVGEFAHMACLNKTKKAERTDLYYVFGAKPVGKPDLIGDCVLSVKNVRQGENPKER